jgi:hypothetical protein
MAPATFKDVALDAVDPLRLGRFWAAALGLALEKLDDGDTALRGRRRSTRCGSTRCPSRGR